MVAPRGQDAEPDQSARRTDQWLAGGDLVLTQVAADDANRRLQRPGEEDRVFRVATGPAVDRLVDREVRRIGLAPDRRDQLFDALALHGGNSWSRYLLPANRGPNSGVVCRGVPRIC